MPETLAYMSRVLERILAKLKSDPVDPHLAYFVRHVTFHEDMHAEAFIYTRQTLAYPAPDIGSKTVLPEASARLSTGDVAIPGGTYETGSRPGTEPLVFDNEKWAHAVRLEPFAIARQATTNGEFEAFVEAGGYSRTELWSPEGWTWRSKTNAPHPVYWRPASSGWEVRHFDRWLPIARDHAIIHVNWYEADAYSRWAKRRLPTEAEWEAAASGPEKRRFPWGETFLDHQHANLDGHTWESST